MSVDKKKSRKSTGLGPQLAKINPLTDNQAEVFNHYLKNHMILDGMPGTGKSFLAMYLALQSVERGDYDRIIMIRSSVSGRDQGFLPGTAEEKMKAYEEPYQVIVKQLYGRDDAYQILKIKKMFDFRSTSNLRGLTFESAVVIVDESQNCTDQELHTVITRLGDTSKLIICGDTGQDDLTSERFKEYSGYQKITSILGRLSDVKHIKFGPEDIVRSGFIKDYILARMKYEE